jgi:hypothetical protein
VGSGAVYVWRESTTWRSVLCWCVWQESSFRRRYDTTFQHAKKKNFAQVKSSASHSASFINNVTTRLVHVPSNGVSSRHWSTRNSRQKEIGGRQEVTQSSILAAYLD